MSRFQMLKNRALYMPVLVLLEVLSGRIQAADETPLSAVEVVERFQTHLLDTMKRGNELNFEGRFNFLDQVVRTTHAAAKISEIVLGRKHWKTLSDEQKKEFIEVFTRLNIATYAHYFKAYSGEDFKFISKQKTRRGNMLIRTVFVESNGNEVQFDYLMIKTGGRWLIINIKADGVSDLAVKRSEYTNVLKREGFEPLLEKLKHKTLKYTKAG